MSEVPGKTGQVIADRYELMTLIGRGGMGCVWRAEHKSLKTPVAVKLLTPTGVVAGSVARFHREAQAAAALRGTNVVHIIDYGVDGDIPYIAMEYLDGESLGTRLRREGRLSPAEAARILTGVVRAISRAHRAGIVHRDLKPDNVFLARDEDAGGEVVKVLDFGIAKIVDQNALDSGPGSTRTGAMLGTPFYMSPEQARGRKDLDARSDLWSLAVIAFECLTGQRPFHADVLGELIMQICSEPIPRPSDVATVSTGFDAWFERATRRDPGERFQTVRAFADALSEVLTPGRPWLETRSDDEAGKPALDDLATAPTEPIRVANGSTGGGALVSSESQDPRAPAPSRARWQIAAAAVVALGLVVVGFRVTGSGDATPVGPSASTVIARTTQVETLRVVPPQPLGNTQTLVPEVRRRLVILPADATVEIDGSAAPSTEGEVVVVGKPGSVHRARLVKGKSSFERDVVITEEGLSPNKVELIERPAAAAPPPNVKTPSPPQPPATPPPRAAEDKPPLPKKFE